MNKYIWLFSDHSSYQYEKFAWAIKKLFPTQITRWFICDGDEKKFPDEYPCLVVWSLGFDWAGEIPEYVIKKFVKSVRLLSERIKHVPRASFVLIMPEFTIHTINHISDSSKVYFLQGLIKSLACEKGCEDTRFNVLMLRESFDFSAAADAVVFLGNPYAYTTAQVFSLSGTEEKRPVNKSRGKVVMITGAGQGIGYATAVEFEKDYRLCLNDLRWTKRLKDMVAFQDAFPVIADISEKNIIQNQIDRAIEKLKRIDVFVANAAFMKLLPLMENSEENTMDHFRINVCGHMNCLEKIIPVMKKQHSGTIIFLSSMFGILGWKNGTGYASSKTSMIGLTKYLSKTLEQYGISVVAVAPGVIDTPQLNADAADRRVSLKKMKEIYAEDTVLRRIGEPKEVACLIRYLADGGAASMSGRIIQTNGGECRCSTETM